MVSVSQESRPGARSHSVRMARTERIVKRRERDWRLGALPWRPRKAFDGPQRGRARNMHPFDCGNARCGLCHREKFAGKPSLRQLRMQEAARQEEAELPTLCRPAWEYYPEDPTQYLLCAGCGEPVEAMWDFYNNAALSLPRGWREVGGLVFCPSHELVCQVVFCDGVPVG